MHYFNTRLSKNYRNHRARIKGKQLSMHCIGPEMWNKLPESLKYVQSLGSVNPFTANVAKTQRAVRKL